MRDDDSPVDQRTAPSGESAGGIGSRRKQSRGRNGLALRNWRVRRRLVAVVLIPVIAAVALGGLRIYSSWQASKDYERVEQLALLGENVTALTHELQLERDMVVGYIARGRSGNPNVKKQQTQVRWALKAVRDQLGAIDESYSPVLHNKVRAMQNRLENLSEVRNAALKTQVTARGAFQLYADIISQLVSVTAEIAGSASDKGRLQERVSALHSLSRLKEQASRQRSLLYTALAGNQFRPGAYQRFLRADARQRIALDEFRSSASVANQQQYEDTVTGQEVDNAARLEAKALARTEAQGRQRGLGLKPQQWFKSMTSKINQMRSVEESLVQDILDRSETLQDEARIAALRDVAIVLLILFVALVVALFVARSMARPLQHLRASALDVAGERLPDMVRQLQESDGRNVDITVERTSIDSSDEIGEVARAFDQVHEEAVRLASEQAALRGNVNAMFVNLSRRSQGLVERQLNLIDSLENSEQDPDQLSSLFKLDHLATRMRRHGENLLVLAGEEPGRRWSEPIPLVDILRAAISEVEQYERIELRQLPNVRVAGRAVNDIVHLAAELLENATSYSSGQAKVVISSNHLEDGRVMLEISDSGIGMSSDELSAVNERLASQPVVDVSVSRRMGLFVVGRLAWRHDIRVQLRTSDTGGVAALIMLSDQLATPVESSVQQPAAAATGSTGVGEPAAAPLASDPAASDTRPQYDQPGAPAEPGAPAGPHPEPVGETTDPAAGAVRSVESKPVYGQQFAATDPGGIAATPASPTREEPQTSPTGFPPASSASLSTASASWAAKGQDDDASAGPPTGNEVPPPAPSPAPASGEQPATYTPAGAGAGEAYDGTAAPAQPPSELRRTESGNIFEESGSGTTEERKQRLPIFDQIESEWFRQRTGRRVPEAAPNGQQPAEPPEPGAAPVQPPPAATPAGNGYREEPQPASHPTPQPAPQSPSQPAQQPAPQPAEPAPEPALQHGGGPRVQASDPAWRSPGDEVWRAAEETISSPTAAGTTTAGLPKRVPGRNFVPGSAGSSEPSSAASAAATASRAPEAVGGRLTSYHQGIRRGRHAGRDSSSDALDDERQALAGSRYSDSQYGQENA